MAHHLLLADDSVTIQRVIKLTFADEDVEVVAVGDGNQAVAAIDRQPPDIVLADVAMPGRSGYEVAQHIRMSPRLAHIPVLLLTGAFEPVDEARAAEVGCDGVLAKPFEPDVVVARVKELLARPRAVASPAAGPFPAPVPPAAAEPALVASLSMAGTAAVEAAAPVALAAPPAPRQHPADVDAYFDRLDQAFASLALSPRPAAPAPSQPVDQAPALPQTLVDAFAGFTTPASGPESPSAPPAAESATPAIAGATLTEAQIDAIVSRVLDRLTQKLGGNLADVVASVAERLVKDEIAQIKRRV